MPPTRLRQQKVTAAQWSSNGGALGTVDLPTGRPMSCPDIPLPAEVLRMPVAFVGVTGSRRTHAERRADLESLGAREALRFTRGDGHAQSEDDVRIFETEF